MNLSKKTIGLIQPAALDLPPAYCLDLPEKVLQFGTGVLLRALPDYFIDKANKQGVFNGRVVVVKSTAKGSADEFERQDGLYTLCIRGIEDGKKIEENSINASISRVLSAKSDWNAILECAANPDMQIVISNTTEVGITLVKDNVQASPPESFPGKLLAFLYRRYQVFQADPAKGMVVIPTELIPDNGSKLLSILLELARENGLEPAFSGWLSNSNHFCNSLVDRIVPGKLSPAAQAEMEGKLGYSDELMIMSEVYRLWAIESASEQVKQILSFSKTDEGVVIAPDIDIYRELKLRLLNGSHTFSCGLAYLAGFKTVKEAMRNPEFAAYIEKLMKQEIAPAITSETLTMEAALAFADKVLDRYRNPYLEHQWLSITMQYTSKMKMRNLPVILKHNQRFGSVPPCMALGFAAHLLFMKSVQGQDGIYYGEIGGQKYPVTDDLAAYYSAKWNRPDTLVKEVLRDESLWGADLSTLPGFETTVSNNLQLMMERGAAAMIAALSAVPA